MLAPSTSNSTSHGAACLHLSSYFYLHWNIIIVPESRSLHRPLTASSARSSRPCYFIYYAHHLDFIGSSMKSFFFFFVGAWKVHPWKVDPCSHQPLLPSETCVSIILVILRPNGAAIISLHTKASLNGQCCCTVSHTNTSLRLKWNHLWNNPTNGAFHFVVSKAKQSI